MSSNTDEHYMRRAIELAQLAAQSNEVPVGAVVVLNDEIIGESGNATISECDPAGHAEVLALRKAAKKVGNYRIPEAHIFITIEPCAMCLGAIVQARLARIIFGAHEPKAGVLQSNQGLLNDQCLNHSFDVKAGVLAEQCAELISSFFRERRTLKAQLRRSAGKAL